MFPSYGTGDLLILKFTIMAFLMEMSIPQVYQEKI